jgi:hypothetical protein
VTQKQTQIWFLKNRQKWAFCINDLKLRPIVDDYVIYHLCKFQVKYSFFNFRKFFNLHTL